MTMQVQHHFRGSRNSSTKWSLTACSIFLLIVSISQAQENTPPRDRYSDHKDLSVVIDGDGTSRPIQSIADWKIRRRHILEGMQSVMGPLPRPAGLPDFDVKTVETLKGDGFVRKSITFTVEGNDRLPADLYLPNVDDEKKRSPAMLALHPTGKQGKRIVAGEGPRANRQYALELAQRGYVVIAPDYPSFGHYDYDFAADSYVSGTMKGIFNHLRCVDLISSMDEVDAQRVGVIGHSLGGHNALFAAAFDARLKVIVSSCGWTPFHDYYGGLKLKNWAQDRYMPRVSNWYNNDADRMPFDFYEVVAAMAPRPFFSNSPEADSNFDVAGVRKTIPGVRHIYELYHAEANLQLRTPPAQHDFPTKTRLEAYHFIDAALEHSPTNRSLDHPEE